MIRVECGQMTIFLSLLFISFFLLLSLCMEGIYIRMQKADFMAEQLLIGEYALANYHKELAEQFHIFGIDGRYAGKMEDLLKRKFEANSGNEVTEFSISNPVFITDREGEYLKHQIREYMKYQEISDLLDKMKQSFNGLADNEEVKKMESTVHSIVEEDTNESIEEKQKREERITKEDPRKGLDQLLKNDILNLVMPEEKEISEKETVAKYGKEDTKKEERVEFFHKKSILDLFDSFDSKQFLNQLGTEGLSVLYAANVFRNAGDQIPEHGLNYEMEYLIAGKSNERENLKSVVYRLLALRFASNYMYLLSDKNSQAQALALAVGIASIGSAVPGITEGIKLLILAAWGYGEAIIDVRSLIKGNKVPFIKTEENWQLSLSNLATLTADEKKNPKGNTYQDYLKILLLLQFDQKEKYRRMMDIMEWRIKEEQEDFELGECIFSYQLTVAKRISFLFYPIKKEWKDSRIYVY